MKARLTIMILRHHETSARWLSQRGRSAHTKKCPYSWSTPPNVYG